MRVRSLVVLVLALTACDNREQAATQEFPVILLKEDDGDLPGSIAGLERYLRLYPETRKVPDAKAELVYLRKLENYKLPELDDAVAKILAAAEDLHKEQPSKKGVLDKTPDPWPDVDAGVLEQEAREVIAATLDKAVRIHLSCRGYYRRNQQYTANPGYLDVRLDPDVYGTTLLPYNRLKNVGYQGYTAEVTDKKHQATIMVMMDGRFSLRVKEKEFARALLRRHIDTR